MAKKREVSLQSESGCADPCNMLPTIPDEEQRSEPRYACAGVIDLFEGTGAPRYIGLGRAQDISKHGASIYSESFVQPGTQLCLKNRYTKFSATVRYVRPTTAGFLIGVQFVRESEWLPNPNWPLVYPGQLAGL